MIEIYKDGKVIHKSRSNRRELRVVLDHARRVGVRQVLCERESQGGVMTFYFGDQSSAIAKFVNFSVAFHWVKSRRSWGMKEASQTHSYFAFDAQTENATQKTLPEHDAKTQSQNEVQK